MSRPQPTVIASIETEDGSTWDILQATTNYVITYKDQPCSIRQHVHTINTQGFKYQKLSYTNLGSVIAQVRRLNLRFKCLDFNYKQV
jgi:hypothetical protein